MNENNENEKINSEEIFGMSEDDMLLKAMQRLGNFSPDTLMPFDEIDKMFGGDIFGMGGLCNISDTNDEDEK